MMSEKQKNTYLKFVSELDSSVNQAATLALWGPTGATLAPLLSPTLLLD